MVAVWHVGQSPCSEGTSWMNQSTEQAMSRPLSSVRTRSRLEHDRTGSRGRGTRRDEERPRGAPGRKCRDRGTSAAGTADLAPSLPASQRLCLGESARQTGGGGARICAHGGETRLGLLWASADEPKIPGERTGDALPRTSGSHRVSRIRKSVARTALGVPTDASRCGHTSWVFPEKTGH